MPKKSKKTCTYCGRTRRVTDDHTPPQGLFAKPRPSNMITVPACFACHRSANQDDEYFISRIALRHTATNDDARDARERFLRSLRNPKKVGWTRDFSKSLSQLPFRSPVGLYLGTRGVYNVDLERLARVVDRTVRGLWRSEQGTIISPSATVASYDIASLQEMPADAKEEFRRMVAVVNAQTLRTIGDGTTFRFKFAVSPGADPASLWLLEFYESTTFLSFVIPDPIPSQPRTT